MTSPTPSHSIILVEYCKKGDKILQIDVLFFYDTPKKYALKIRGRQRYRNENEILKLLALINDKILNFLIPLPVTLRRQAIESDLKCFR